MRLMSKAIDKLPRWAKVILAILTVIGSIYVIAKEGFWIFLLKVIFSPTIPVVNATTMGLEGRGRRLCGWDR